MRILAVSNVFPPGFIGGYELGALDIVRGLIARGHQVRVLTSDHFQDDQNQLLDMNIERTLKCYFMSHEFHAPTSIISSGCYIEYGNIRKLGSAVRRFKPDAVVLFNVRGLGPLGILQFLQGSGIPLILYLMDNVFQDVNSVSAEYSKYVSIFGPPGLDRSTKIIAISRNVMREVSDTLGAAFGDVSYIPGWVHLADAAVPNVATLGAETRFVMCSYVAPHKGMHLVVDATEQLVRQGVTGFSIDVYGAGEVGPLLQKVQSSGVTGYIRCLGCKPKDEMLRLFANYDALLFPTWEREAFGFVVPEAAAAGCFSIMTAGIGASEWFVDDVDCMKITRTVEALATAMYRTIVMGPDERRQLRVTAMQSARRYLTADRWMNSIERECIKVRKNAVRSDCDATRGIEAALLFLSQLWKLTVAS